MSPSSTIAIVGLGYVGLPLLLAYARKGYRVIGFDIDSSKNAHILRGESYIKNVADIGQRILGPTQFII